MLEYYSNTPLIGIMIKKYSLLHSGQSMNARILVYHVIYISMYIIALILGSNTLF